MDDFYPFFPSIDDSLPRLRIRICVEQCYVIKAYEGLIKAEKILNNTPKDVALPEEEEKAIKEYLSLDEALILAAQGKVEMMKQYIDTCNRFLQVAPQFDQCSIPSSTVDDLIEHAMMHGNLPVVQYLQSVKPLLPEDPGSNNAMLFSI